MTCGWRLAIFQLAFSVKSPSYIFLYCSLVHTLEGTNNFEYDISWPFSSLSKPSRSKGSIPLSVMADRGLGPDVFLLLTPSFLRSDLQEIEV